MKKILLNLLALIFILTACSDNSNGGIDIDTGNPDPAPPEGPVAEMSFRSAVAANQTINMDDKGIVQLDLVVCKDGECQYTRPGYFSILYGTFRSTLQVDQGVDIYYFANCRSVLESAGMTAGEAWATIENRLILTETESIIDGQKVLPMWGYMKNVTITDNVVNNLGTIRLLRSVASVNVTFDPERTGLDFTPTIAYLYFGADKAYASPIESNWDLKNEVLQGIVKPLSPDDMTTTVKKESGFDEATGMSNTFYTFDNSADTYLDGSTQNRRTRLVVGGYFDDPSTLSYYPLDFFKTGQDSLLKVTRNSQYSLTITSVNGEGWPDPDIAADKAPVNITYDVINWTENTHKNIAVDGVDYLSISTKSVTLQQKEGSKAVIRVSGTFEADAFTLSFKGNHNGEQQLSGTGVGIENNRFRVEMVGNETNHTITVTALGNYSANANENLDEFVIEAGRIRFNVDIKQINSGGWYDGGKENIIF